MANTKSKQKSTNKKSTNKKKNNSKKGMLLTIAITVVVVAALAVVLTLALGGKKKSKTNLMKSEGKHITVTGEQRLLQLCDMIEGGLAYTETYSTEGMENYYTGDGTRNCTRATFTDEKYNWDVEEFFDGTSGYVVDHSNKTVSKFVATYEDIQTLSAMGMYIAYRDANNLKFVGATEEKFEGNNCYVETYKQNSAMTGENTIKAYFYDDTPVAFVTENQYKTIIEYVELVEGADETKFTYTQLEGYTENF